MNPGDPFYLFGTDDVGRDTWSRLIYVSQVSLSVGLVGVFLSLVLGILLGGLSGLIGGWVDTLIQRLIEVIRSIPDIPLWRALATAVPPRWYPIYVYFGITIILSFIGWTGMAREVRGKFLALREEDFIVGAELDGVPRSGIIIRHMIPSFLSHICDRVNVMYVGKLVESAEATELYRHPKHPYTEALLSVVPIHNPRLRNKACRIRLQGDVADPANPPGGCYFHPRCQYAEAHCATEEPLLRPMENSAEEHHAACHFASQLKLRGVIADGQLDQEVQPPQP